MEELLLRQICDSVGVSRRAVQGYEKMGLVSPVGKNKMGYLVYDSAACERIRQIKLFQNMGFSLKEIKLLYDSTEKEYKDALESRLLELNKRSEQINKMISILKNMISEL